MEKEVKTGYPNKETVAYRDRIGADATGAAVWGQCVCEPVLCVAWAQIERRTNKARLEASGSHIKHRNFRFRHLYSVIISLTNSENNRFSKISMKLINHITVRA
jgi:hypothetical protein